MKLDNSFVHLFRTPGDYYIYDVNRNLIIKTNKDIWESLQNKDILQDNELIDSMIKNGLMSSNRMNEIVHPVDEIIEDYLNNKVNMITLQVTQQCNLRCKYCIYSGGYENREHSNKKMDFETAKKGVDFLINHSKDVGRISVGFYGGEPLLEFELIKRIIEYAELKSEGKEILFTVTTNATLLIPSVVEYLEKHNISMVISLDGPRDIHDKNRRFAGNNCGTFDSIMDNLGTIREYFRNYFDNKIMFNAVIDPENDFNCTNQFFTSYEAIKDSVTNSSIVKDTYSKSEIILNSDFSAKLNYEYFKIFLMKLNRFDSHNIAKLFDGYIFRMNKMNQQLNPVPGLHEKGHHGGPCIPGVQRLFLNANGDLYPCERVSETSDVMKIGNINIGFNLDKVRNILNIGKITEEKCKNCWAFRFCYLCAAYADDLTEISSEKKSSFCSNVRYSAESDLKDYCTLREFGYSYEENIPLFEGA